LLEQPQKTYEYCVVADVDGPEIAMQLEGRDLLSLSSWEFTEEFEKKRKAPKKAVGAQEKAAAKKKKEDAAAKAASKKPQFGMPSIGGFGPAHYKAIGGKRPLYIYSCGK
jgi:hypothetical protein